MEFASILIKGGPVVYILLGLSVYVLSIVIYKLHILYKVNFFRSDVTEESLAMWLNNNKEDAYKIISKDKHPQKEVVSFTMYHLLKNKMTQDKERYLREEVSRLSQERLEYFDSNLDTLKVMKKYFTSMVATEAKRYKHRWLPEADKQSILEMRRIRKSLQKKNKSRMSLKLGNVAESLGISAEGWHSAKFDVETLISTTERMLELFKDNAGKELRPEKHFL